MKKQLETLRLESWIFEKLPGMVIGSSVACLIGICLASAANGQTTITSNTTQAGGTVTTPGNGLLQITHGSNNPLLTLTGSAVRNSAAVVVGSLNSQSGQLLIESGSSLNNNMGSPLQNMGTIGSETIFSGRGYIGLEAGSNGDATVSGSTRSIAIKSHWTKGSANRVCSTQQTDLRQQPSGHPAGGIVVTTERDH